MVLGVPLRETTYVVLESMNPTEHVKRNKMGGSLSRKNEIILKKIRYIAGSGGKIFYSNFMTDTKRQ